MTNLNYTNYLKNKNFDFETAYKEIFISKFQIILIKKQAKKEVQTKIRNEFKLNNKNIFDDNSDKSLEEIFTKFKEKKIDEFDVIFQDKDLQDILTLSQDEIIKILEKNKNKSSLSKLKYVFNYEKFQSEITKFFTDNFDFRTCFYCNKDFITNFDADKKVSTFQLDHFYDKGKYPYLALSFYNLIPSCPTCNSSKVKGAKNTFEHDSKVGTFENETCIAPNDKTFDFHQKVKFKLLLDKNCKHLYVKDKEDIDIPLKEQFTEQYDKYIEIFKLNERYKAHKDIVFDMIQKAELYPESRLKELQDLTGIPFQQIKKDIFNLIYENEDLSKKPFSKIIVDMSKELGLL
ncbi:MAG: HNH endonuclease [Arcobacteraceae bacterium]